MARDSLWAQVDTDLYEALCVPQTATDIDIQQAWHRAARATHPDAGGDESRFRAVHVAYLVLSDPVQRAEYDARHGVVSAPRTAPDPGVAATASPGSVDLSTERQPLPSRLVLALVLITLGAVLLSYAWPWFTIVTGFAVGGFVLFRYFRHWQRRGSVS